MLFLASFHVCFFCFFRVACLRHKLRILLSFFELTARGVHLCMHMQKNEIITSQLLLHTTIHLLNLCCACCNELANNNARKKTNENQARERETITSNHHHQRRSRNHCELIYPVRRKERREREKGNVFVPTIRMIMMTSCIVLWTCLCLLCYYIVVVNSIVSLRYTYVIVDLLARIMGSFLNLALLICSLVLFFISGKPLLFLPNAASFRCSCFIVI